MKVTFQITFLECISCFAFRRFRFGTVLLVFAQQSFDSGLFQLISWYGIFCSVISEFLWITLETNVEVDDGSAKAWFFTTCYLQLTLSDSLDGLLSDGRDCSILLLRFLPRVGCFDWQETNSCAASSMGLFILWGLWCHRTQLDPQLEHMITCFYCLSVNLLCVPKIKKRIRMIVTNAV